MRTFRPAQPTDPAPGRQVIARLGVVLLACSLTVVSGCTSSLEEFYDSKLSLDQPVDWWHQLQGGPIANERPPPPGIADPYPNLASVPAKPVPTDAATRAGLSTQLAAQRDRARLLAAQDPVVFPGAKPPTAPNKAPATPTATPAQSAAPAADDAPSTMVLDAANTSAPPARTAPVARPAAAPAHDPTAPAAFSNPPASSGPVVSGPIPPLPTAAPPLPKLPGLPSVDPAPVVARVRPSATFRFAPGSASLPEEANGSLRALAERAAGGPIAITAGGDAASTAPTAQGAALPLALRRTGAMAAVLIAAGVPSGAIRAQAVSSGREASARLVD